MEKLNSFIEKVNAKYSEYKIIVSGIGPKWIKLKLEGKFGKQIFAFIDKATGDIYKPATYQTPAKHARGNINSDQNGMEALSLSEKYGTSIPFIRYFPVR